MVMEGIIEAQIIMNKSFNFDLDDFKNYLEGSGCNDIQFSDNENELTVNYTCTQENLMIDLSEYGSLVASSYFDSSTIAPEIE